MDFLLIYFPIGWDENRRPAPIGGGPEAGWTIAAAGEVSAAWLTGTNCLISVTKGNNYYKWEANFLSSFKQESIPWGGGRGWAAPPTTLLTIILAVRVL